MDLIDSPSALDGVNVGAECAQVSLKIASDQHISLLSELEEEDDHDNLKLHKRHKIKRVVYSDDEEILEKPTNSEFGVDQYADAVVVKSPLFDARSELSELDKSDDEEVDSVRKEYDNGEISLSSEIQEDQQHLSNNVEEEGDDKNIKDQKKGAEITNRINRNDNLTIQSEQQRLCREAHISVPYHKPRKHTLEEFLQRRTIIKPELITNDTSHVSSANLITTAIHRTKNSKMTAEELEIYAKHLEERAKECSEFFKSEDEDDNTNFKSHDAVYDDDNKQNDKQHQVENVICITEKCNLPEVDLDRESEKEKPIDYNYDNVQQLTENDLEDILQQEDLLTKSPTDKRSSLTKVNDSLQINMDILKKRSLINIKNFLRNKKLCNNSRVCEENMIDLDAEHTSVPYGDYHSSNPDLLVDRLMKNSKEKQNSVSVSANNKLEIPKVNVPIKEENNKLLYRGSKPGEAHLKFKLYLKEIINNKRLEELKKKQNENRTDKECTSKGGQVDEVESEEEEVADEDDEDENYDEDDDCENRHICKTLEKVNGEDDELLDEEEIQVVDEDNLNSSENDDHDDDDGESSKALEEEDDEGSNCIDNEDLTLKNRIVIKPCDDENDSDNDDINFLKTQSPTSVKESENCTFTSGALDVTDKSEKPTTAIISQVPLLHNNYQTGINNNNEDEVEELVQLCSGSFQTQTQKQHNAISVEMDDKEEFSNSVTRRYNKLLSSDCSDDETDENFENKIKLTDAHVQKKIKRLRKKVKKNRIYNLSISDEEDETKSEENKCVQNCEEIEIEEKEVKGVDTLEAESYVAFDSEESLIDIPNEEYLKQAEQFLENEAELSESDWGSADEDEENLDCYDAELGDEDQYDQVKLRNELEKIHARKMLDEDIREVRKIQEIFLNDQEEESAMRQRQFRWRNISEGNFSLDDVQQNDNDELNNKAYEEEISEQIWRKNRFEREKLLQKYKGESDNSSQIMLNDNNGLNGRRFQKVLKNNGLDESISTDIMAQTSFLIAKGFNITRHRKIARQSFLMRDQEILYKVANLSKDISGTTFHNDDGTPTLMINTNKPKNFTFTTLTAEEHAKLKRKPKDVLNSSNDEREQKQQDGNDTTRKKLKLERSNKCLIDQLL